ncbi:3'-5' exonuclease [Tardiphaga alba]|uniref:3'-5' exonuclease n=1 Tax=Tardiphaga alba TaxID=340268 RepID=UPI002011B057|nr:3'-5' exonuclease [Tardiphaga alba]
MKAHLSTEDDIIAENDDLGRMAALLQASCDFRVLQRLKPRSIFEPRDGSPTRRALLVDVETTGLDPKSDEVIELALLPVVYGLDGRIFEVGEAFVNLRQPTRQIPAAVTVLTGITDEMVVGKKLDLAKAVALIAEADLIIAHNAAFDRKFVEKLIGDVAKKPWACSMADVDWAREGYEGSKLAYLAMRTGFFFEGHRAADDCFAAVEILAQQLPSTEGPQWSSFSIAPVGQHGGPGPTAPPSSARAHLRAGVTVGTATPNLVRGAGSVTSKKTASRTKSNSYAGPCAAATSARSSKSARHMSASRRGGVLERLD